MPKINKIKARSIFDSRGYPTVEVEIILGNQFCGRFIVPSGASKGKKEAVELRDKDKGVSLAVNNVNEIITPGIINQDFLGIEELDNRLINLDGSKNKSHLGANAILGVSGAFFKALAQYNHRPLYDFYDDKKNLFLPLPLLNVINGGAHANNGLSIQEFMIVPIGAKTFRERLNWAHLVISTLKNLLKKEGHSTAVGDEGGFAPRLSNSLEALDLLTNAIKKAGFILGKDISIALDIAANEFYDESSDCYMLDSVKMSSDELINWYKKIHQEYKIFSFEDPFFEEDYSAYKIFTKEMGEKVQIVGDDLFVTNDELIKDGIKNQYANAVLIKMNQVGTISETIKAVRTVQKAGWQSIISHRSGDSEDTTIADLAVMLNAGQIKSGSLCRSERVAKYNQLLRIEEELSGNKSNN